MAKKQRKAKKAPPAKRAAKESDAQPIHDQGTNMPLSQFAEQVAKMANSLHHAGLNVPCYTLLVGDRHYGDIVLSGNMRRPIDRLRLIGAGMSAALLQVTRGGEPVELLEMQGAPPELRTMYGELAPRYGET